MIIFKHPDPSFSIGSPEDELNIAGNIAVKIFRL